MAKRKNTENHAGSDNRMDEDGSGSGSGSDEDVDMIKADFDFFDPAEIDFHGLKSLTRQLLDIDAELINTSELVDLIVSQPLVGSTVKVDGKESDPFAFMTVLNLQAHHDKPVIQTLTTYLHQKLSTIPSLAASSDLLAPTNTAAQVGLILTERIINLPSEISPPMYSMLLEEIAWAVQEKEPYAFTHYLILSKTYKEITSLLAEPDSRPSKKSKKDNSGDGEMFFFHPEDEVLQKHSLGYGSFDYSKLSDAGASDAKRAFQEAGIKPQGYLMLIEAAKIEGAVEAITEYLKPPS
ncbi:Protein bcp1 [Venturia nashicola]|uniref:Protein BCP1 n=1 Tax=Venturia nashicola TaxID=86259 RepID=A0A4Z1PC36_9PEZI|nr:Protein bcp1 [Venturia nashicola]TLD38044.1 Protein bcp1 [Venturia nashicola]